MTVRIEPGAPGCGRLVVRDNGIGIAPENLTRIFSHGFTTRSYAQALTSYRAQGMTVDESILVLGHQSAETLCQRQLYVGKTRYRERHHLYVASHQTVVRRLKHLQDDRELATEFMDRQNVTHTHSRRERMQERIKHWLHWQQRQDRGERQGLRV